MFDNLRNAFKEAVENFKTELGRDEVPEAVDRLLAGMYSEATDAKAYVSGLERDLASTRASAKRETDEAATCRRREGQAAQISDEETARVAAEFAEKHERRAEVLEGKAEAIRQELLVRRAEVEEMFSKIKEARQQREALASTTGRTEARDSMGNVDDLFSDFDRMEQKISGTQSEADAASAFDEEMGLDDAGRPVVDVDDQLDELKRRMGQE